jgi:LysM repeat protein
MLVAACLFCYRYRHSKVRVTVKLSANDVAQLNNVVTTLQKILAQGGSSAKTVNGRTPTRTKRKGRRSGKELVAFRKMLIAERKKGVPVAKLAERHGITASYIYQL